MQKNELSANQLNADALWQAIADKGTPGQVPLQKPHPANPVGLPAVPASYKTT